MRRFLTVPIVILTVLALTVSISLAKGESKEETNQYRQGNADVAPSVAITSPEDGTTINEDTLDVVVEFGPKDKGRGNVKYILLHLDGSETARYEKPANIKGGIHTFTLDIKDLDFGDHTLQAFAYQGEIKAGHEGQSEIVTFTISPIVWQVSANNPVDVVVDNDRNVYVLESAASYVSMYDKDGISLGGVSLLSAGSPMGIALDKDKNIFVADTGNSRISKYKLDNGSYALDTTFSEDGHVEISQPEGGQLPAPHGIALDSDGNVYVSDNSNNRILKFGGTTGRFIKTVGSLGTDSGCFDQPKGVFIDFSGYIYVVDSGNNRIQKITQGGSFLKNWELIAQFNQPCDLAGDSYYIYVVDFGNNQIPRFDIYNQYIATIDNLDLNNPQAIAVDEDRAQELIYIADTGNNRLVKVSIPIPAPKKTWNQVKDLLKQKDIEGALVNFSEASKTKYRDAFTKLSDELPRIINDMQDIYLVSIEGDVAKYFTKQIEDGVEKGYFVCFIKDENGDWKVDVW